MKQIVNAQKLFLIGTVLSMLFLLNNMNVASAQTEGQEAASEETNIVRDSAVVLLDGKTLAGNQFIHLYDTTPYIIMNGHVAAKLPCDDNSESPVKVLVGSAPNLTAAEFEVIGELSTPGEVCLYHVDLESMSGGNASDIVTDIAIQNPTGDPIEFGPTTTVVIGINEIMKGAHEAEEGSEHEAEEGTEGESTENATDSE